ncbi:MAG: LysM peptidoglycan-binding domain-containing protein [Victivallaceae bacterium]|nr:LysM peptidoglycan-binding domain-containing protein [Victivallaceae bacterium]
MKRLSTILMPAALAALLTGCSLKTADESSHPLFKLAVKAQKANEIQQAVKYFNRYLAIKPDSSRTHLLLASLYDENLDQPLHAVYHYERFLEYAPTSPEAPNVKKWLEAARRKYYYRTRLNYNDPEDVSALQNELYTTQRKLEKLTSLRERLVKYARELETKEKTFLAESAQLKAAHRKTLAELEQARSRIRELSAPKPEVKKTQPETEKAAQTPAPKAEKAAPGELPKPEVKKTQPENQPEAQPVDSLKTGGLPEAAVKPGAKSDTVSPSPQTPAAAPPFIPKKTENAVPKPETAGVRSYTVQKGDSLSSISRKFYGSARYYQTIFDANREILPAERALRPGQVLKIPPL